MRAPRPAYAILRDINFVTFLFKFSLETQLKEGRKQASECTEARLLAGDVLHMHVVP